MFSTLILRVHSQGIKTSSFGPGTPFSQAFDGEPLGFLRAYSFHYVALSQTLIKFSLVQVNPAEIGQVSLQ